MKVLMFGWEFPPHISGGLGTACQGLTHALVEEDVALTFVVPKLFGNEDQSQFPILSASEIPVVSRSLASDEDADYQSGHRIDFSGERIIKKSKVRTNDRHMNLIEVESSLLPYGRPSAKVRRSTVRDWNQEWHEVMRAVGAKASRSQHDNIMYDDSEPGVTSSTFHTFAGGYGKDLLRETLSYAEVASEIAHTQSFDLIHAHDWITYPAGLTAKKVSGKKLIVHVHATEIDRSGTRPHPVVFAIEKEGLQYADHVVAVSEWTREILVKHYAVDRHKISVVHNGVVEHAPSRDEPPQKLGSHYITFLGRITYQKGPMYFVQAAYKVLQRFPEARFIVAGSGDMMPEMIELVAKLRMSRSFHFTGFLKGQEINTIWSLTDLYVMPSVSEPFGITPLEASQAGVPVIVSNQSGVAEVMSHAIKVDFWDVDAMANAICNVLAYPSLAKTLSSNSKRELSDITWITAAKKLKIVYEKQLNIL